MKTSHKIAFRIAVVMVSVTTYLVAPGFSPGGIFEAKQTSPPRISAEHAKTIPVSNKMITAKITVDDHDYSAEYSQLEGGLIRIEKAGGAIYGFSPFVSGPANETITIKVYRINKMIDAEGAIKEGLSEASSLVANKTGKYFATYADAEGSFKIEVLDVQTNSRAKEKDSEAQNNLDDALSECCVSCRGDDGCACRIVTACGECCGGVCCRK